MRTVTQLVLLIGLFAVWGSTSATIYYVQPLLADRWEKREITVSIDGMPQETDRQLLARALTLWNDAQDWFLSKHIHGRGHTIRFRLLEKLGDVQVTFSSSKCLDSLGSATKTSVCVVTDLSFSFSILMHELGHVLGLDHPEVYGDLMYGDAVGYEKQRPNAPSTMNLYTLWLLANDEPEVTVRLPFWIPYELVPDQCLP